jgi:hypothetical protein
MGAKKGMMMFTITMLMHFYTTFVLQSLWNWFVAGVLNLPHISYWETYGIVLIINLLTYSPSFKDDQRWKWLEIILPRCIPAGFQTEVMAEIQAEKENLSFEIGTMIFGIAVGNTVSLVLGWGVHTFLV